MEFHGEEGAVKSCGKHRDLNQPDQVACRRTYTRCSTKSKMGPYTTALLDPDQALSGQHRLQPRHQTQTRTRTPTPATRTAGPHPQTSFSLLLFSISSSTRVF